MTTFSSLVGAFPSLIKVKITRTVVFTAFLGYLFALPQPQDISTQIIDCLIALLAIAAVCAGFCALNHILEVHWDAQMSRTKNRPLLTGAVSKTEATLISIILISLGCIIMWTVFSPALALGALATGLLYDFVYTPLKRYSPWNTTIGAIPGALPVLGGAVAASTSIPPLVYVLFFVVFLWQHPHFYAIAWVYREDYARAGYRMLSGPSHDKAPKAPPTHIFAISFSITILLALVTISLPLIIPSLSIFYTLVNVLLSIWFLRAIAKAWKNPLTRQAQHIILVSVFYILGWMSSIIIDHFIAF